MWFDMILHDISWYYTSGNNIYSTLNIRTNKTLIWYNNNIWWYMMYVFHLSLRSLLQYLSILSSNMHATHRGLLHECRKIWGNSVKPQTGRLKLVRVSLISQQKYGNHHLLVSCFLTCFQICWDILLLFVSWKLEGLVVWLWIFPRRSSWYFCSAFRGNHNGEVINFNQHLLLKADLFETLQWKKVYIQ